MYLTMWDEQGEARKRDERQEAGKQDERQEAGSQDKRQEAGKPDETREARKQDERQEGPPDLRAQAYVGVHLVVRGEPHGVDRGKPDENLIKQKGLVKRSYKKLELCFK